MILLLKILIFAPPAILAITLHEVAHGWAANQLGDPTAARLGRLSLNPFKHIDLLGSVVIPAAVYLASGSFFGWAKPVPVDWRNLKHMPRDIALVAAAGPASNLLMLAAWAVVLRLVGDSSLLGLMSWTGVFFNATIMLLNLIPIPPLDGSRIVTSLLPPRLAIAYNKVEPFGLVILAALLMGGLVGAVLSPALSWIERVIQLLVA
ncbi:MAG: site-2 protease family protein [Gammaproteobacteria bacterium]|nr:site-2 protease family protein [Gammaproteobacteria bacterium]